MTLDTRPAYEPPAGTDVLPTEQEVELMFRRKFAPLEAVGWSPRRRLRWRYFSPADVYEALISKLVFPGCAWLDVGGGHDIFPENPRLARELTARCSKVTAVDPSENVRLNEFVHERVQSGLEDYQSDAQFDLATMRMVVEHVTNPDEFVRSLHRLVRPGGVAVILTVNRWSPISVLSSAIPFRWHHGIKRVFWGGEDKDTFPVAYRMNTLPALRLLFKAAGFEEQVALKVDDLSAFGLFKTLNYVELSIWKALRRFGIGYPENCLLAVFRRPGQ